ncbi:RpiB/LacA/LacB family sugar-phosphate isomerase [Pectinatus sottacetonis]|uniref:RpiB/LacA/LacB family sugar-phosphate isomerase n=1 Tax=Pectinatus sottacetonis TaxID=1002795 RepID=UPI0018C72ED8|nr:RpiB/LacA/LacB family sugar-phosphate isomerase [Pectinatus sottacetonis]
MNVVIAADKSGQKLKQLIRIFLEAKENDYKIVDLSDSDIYTSTMNVVNAITNKTADRGIIVDAYAVAPFMIANKNHGIICASIYEDYTAQMTRTHNNTQIICLGAKITADNLSCKLAYNFLKSEYAGGRHQIRVDMLNRML